MIFIFALILSLTGCKSWKEVVYVQNAGTPAQLSSQANSAIPDAKIKVGDLLIITVNTQTPEAAQSFNLPLMPSGEGVISYAGGSRSQLTSGLGMQNYLVDTDGNITFPIIGKIQTKGMTKADLSLFIQSKIYPQYTTDVPIVLVRYANYKISVLGEVTRPNVYKIDNEQISILEAIALAGDLTIFGRRDNVLLIRDNNGERVSVRIDLRDANLINSEYFYLQQNDVLYIQPNDPKTRASNFSTAETITISIVGTLISLSSLVVNLLR